jgi:putative tricarboxylic transport membrane protein
VITADRITKDAIGGLLLLALAAGYYRLTLTIPSSSLSDEVGADGLPIVLATALAVVACLLLAKSLFAWYSANRTKTPPSKTPVDAAADDEADEQAPLVRAFGFIMIGIAYMVVAPLVGFAIGIAALVVTVALYEREPLSLKLVAVAAAGGLGFWLIFVRFLGTEQPFSSLLAMLLKS